MVSVWEMKANWSEIERQVAHGETFKVMNRGKPSVRIIPVAPRKILKWDDFLGTAIRTKGKTGEETIDYGKGSRCC